MQLFIPTYARPHKQKTAFLLSEAKIPHYLVVRNSEKDDYEWAEDETTNLMVLPEGICNISGTRQYILHNATDKHICMLDDDVDFLIRRGPLPEVHLRGATPDEVHQMFNLLEGWLNEGYVHTAISQREGNNRIERDFLEVGRGIRIVAYNRETVLSLGCRFDRVDTKEDLDMTLQLLRLGYPNRISYYYAQGQTDSNAEGGCQTYRTRDHMKWSSGQLAKLHSSYVQVTRVFTRGSFGGGERTDVRIQWKYAYDEGRRIRQSMDKAGDTISGDNSTSSGFDTIGADDESFMDGTSSSN